MLSFRWPAPRLVRRLKYKSNWQYRLATSRFRSLPDFIIIGAQRSGTTSLYYYLFQHPEILPCFRKEVHYFDGGLDPDVDNYAKGEEWYRAHFPLKRSLRGRFKTGEASPLYIFNPLAPKRIFDLIPEVKIITILRNPAERAISHYFHVARQGLEPLPIMEALQEEDRRMISVIHNKAYKSNTFNKYSYRSRGLYHEQLERYLQYFSRRQMLVLSSEELFREPEATLGKVYEFVGVESGFKVKDLTARNIGKNRVEVDLRVYEYLHEFFWPHNQALYKLIDRSFDW